MHKRIKVAVCGAPQVGKSTVLEKLASMYFDSKPVRNFDEVSALVEIRGDWKGRDLLLATIPGPILYFEKKVSELLMDADVVVYVINPDLGSGLDQRKFLDDYLKITDRFNLGLESGRWMLVLNKIDFGTSCACLGMFPEALRKAMILTDAYKGAGLSLILDAVSKMDVEASL